MKTVRAKKLKIREKPYASANKLAEYVSSNALGRKKLLQLMKFPNQFPSHNYSESRSGIADYLVTGDGAAMQRLFKRLDEDDSGSDYERKTRATSVEGINAWWDRIEGNLPDFTGFTLSPPGEPFKPLPKLPICGVEVSVAPDLVAIGGGKVGFVKLHFKKTFEMSVKAGEFVATLLYRYGEEFHGDDGRPSHKHCVVVDVMSSGVKLEEDQLPIFACPKGMVTKLKEISATCEEIAALWPSIQSPPGWRP